MTRIVRRTWALDFCLVAGLNDQKLASADVADWSGTYLARRVEAFNG
jgi:hypothetical protein